MRAKKETNIKIGQTIKTLRVQNSYTQDKLSEILGITVNHLSAIERGASGASLETLKKIMDLFGVSAEFLLFGENEDIDTLSVIVRKLKRLSPEQLANVDRLLNDILDIIR